MPNRKSDIQQARSSRERPHSEANADIHRAETGLRLVIDKLRDYATASREASRALLDALDAMADHRMFLVPGDTDSGEVGSRREGRTLLIDALTQRQREILTQLAEGRSTKEIAASLGISSKTADAHRAQIMQKLGLRSQSELIFFAIRAGIVRLS